MYWTDVYRYVLIGRAVLLLELFVFSVSFSIFSAQLYEIVQNRLYMDWFFSEPEKGRGTCHHFDLRFALTILFIGIGIQQTRCWFWLLITFGVLVVDESCLVDYLACMVFSTANDNPYVGVYRFSLWHWNSLNYLTIITSSTRFLYRCYSGHPKNP